MSIFKLWPKHMLRPFPRFVHNMKNRFILLNFWVFEVQCFPFPHALLSTLLSLFLQQFLLPPLLAFSVAHEKRPSSCYPSPLILCLLNPMHCCHPTHPLQKIIVQNVGSGLEEVAWDESAPKRPMSEVLTWEFISDTVKVVWRLQGEKPEVKLLMSLPSDGEVMFSSEFGELTSYY